MAGDSASTNASVRGRNAESVQAQQPHGIDIATRYQEFASVRWLLQPKAHNYPAAASYLALIYRPDVVDRLIDELRVSPITTFRAKDIVRASGHTMLTISNQHVADNLDKIRRGIELSPVLLVRVSSQHTVLIADGFHRVSALYIYGEDIDVHAKIATGTA